MRERGGGRYNREKLHEREDIENKNHMARKTEERSYMKGRKRGK